MASKSTDALIAAMSEDSRDLLQRGQHLADCQVVTSDQHVFNLHKMILTQESMVLGCAPRSCSIEGSSGSSCTRNEMYMTQSTQTKSIVALKKTHIVLI